MKIYDDITTNYLEIEAIGFCAISKYIHEVYDNITIDNVTGGEAYIVGLVHATEKILAAISETDMSKKLSSPALVELGGET